MTQVGTLGKLARAGGSRVFGICASDEDGVDDGRQRRLCDDHSGRLVVNLVDLERPEDGAVEELAGVGSDGGVELFGVGEELDDLLEAGGDFFAGGLGVPDEPLGVSDLGGDAGLPLFEDADLEGVGHVSVEQLLAVAFELGEAALLVGDEP